ncbi:MAG: hypothetical protein Q7J28_02670 [Caulobacter sp.]|nr:hypothetical protein [Caulobacter sp.]
MQPAATIYYRARHVPGAIDLGADQTEPLRPYGRWSRILDALVDGPARLRDIHHAVRKPDSPHSGRVEKHMTVRALFAMVQRGLVRHCDIGFELTAAGVAAQSALGQERAA